MISFINFLNKLKDEDTITIEFTKEELNYIVEALDVLCDEENFYTKEDEEVLANIINKICNAVESEE